MSALEDRLATEQPEAVSFAALPEPSPAKRKDPTAIHIHLGEMEIEIPSGANPESIRTVIEALKC